MQMKVECEVEDYRNTSYVDYKPLTVKSYDDKIVELVVDGCTVRVSGLDLIKAVKNCLNV